MEEAEGRVGCSIISVCLEKELKKKISIGPSETSDSVGGRASLEFQANFLIFHEN